MHHRTSWSCSRKSSYQSNFRATEQLISSFIIWFLILQLWLWDYLSGKKTDWNMNHSHKENMTNRQELWVMLHAELQKSQVGTFLMFRARSQAAEKHFVPETFYLSLTLCCQMRAVGPEWDLDNNKSITSLYNSFSLLDSTLLSFIMLEHVSRVCCQLSEIN